MVKVPKYLFYFSPFYYNFGAYLHKYKFQLYYFKLVHCGVVVTTRASQVQGIGDLQFWPGRGPPNFLP